MRRESKLLANALLSHHRQVTKATPPGKKIIESHYTIPYGRLCATAGVPHVLPVISQFLLEVAEWSAEARPNTQDAIAFAAGLDKLRLSKFQPCLSPRLESEYLADLLSDPAAARLALGGGAQDET